MAHLKARRYARERGAKGSHTLAEWKELKLKHNFLCAICEELGGKVAQWFYRYYHMGWNCVMPLNFELNRKGE
jgi:hypothetical protein